MLDRAHANLRARLASTGASIEAVTATDAVPVRPRRRTGMEATMRAERRDRRVSRYETGWLLHQLAVTRQDNHQSIADTTGAARSEAVVRESEFL